MGQAEASERPRWQAGLPALGLYWKELPGARDSARSRGALDRWGARVWLLGVVGGHECCAGDDEAEREDAGGDREWAGADGLAEDQDPADDRGQVATEVKAMTSTPGPSWRLRADA
jgi:hypothetical protein